MQLNYRGTTYNISTNKITVTGQSTGQDSPQFPVKLIYRGHTFAYTPKPMLKPAPVPADAPTVTLIYRGQTYTKPYSSWMSSQPRAINWRWQVM